MKVLVTGGHGFIGSNFIKILLERHPDAQVTNIDSLTYSANPKYLDQFIAYNNIGEDQYRFKKQSINSINFSIFENPKWRFEDLDYIVNFAAESHVDNSINNPDPFVDTNINGTYSLLKLVKLFGSPKTRFVQISTDEVYGSIHPAGYATENHPLHPTSPYAASKTAADHLVMSYHKTFGLNTVITRSGNNYGPNQHREKFVPAAILNLLQGKPATIYGKGEEERQWIYVKDNCRGILSAMVDGEPGGIYNIGSNTDPIKNIDMYNLIFKMMYPLKDPASLANMIPDPRPGHDFRYCMSSELARRTLQWEPLVKMSGGIWATIEWYKHNGQTN